MYIAIAQVHCQNFNENKMMRWSCILKLVDNFGAVEMVAVVSGLRPDKDVVVLDDLVDGELVVVVVVGAGEQVRHLVLGHVVLAGHDPVQDLVVVQRTVVVRVEVGVKPGKKPTNGSKYLISS